MAIPLKISQLTALALKDKVLTLTEKRTIIDAAIREGVSEHEITSYLDNALKESLKSYSKEQLKRCPHCGAQVPLISDDCLFCGNSLQNVDTQAAPPVYITGTEADIINRENLNTAAEQRNLKQCPDCGAPFPLISNVCTHCGHILHEQTDSALNIKNLIENIQNSIRQLQSSPKPTLMEVVQYRMPVALFMFAVVLLVSGFLFLSWGLLAGGMFILSIVLLFFSFRSLSAAKKSVSPVKQADDIFYDALHSHEMYSRQINTLYGDNAEARDILQNFASEIDAIKQKRLKSRNVLSLSILGAIVAVAVLPAFAPSARTSYDRNVAVYQDIYNVANIKTTLKPSPKTGTDGDAAKYFSAASDGDLSIDVINLVNGKNHALINITSGSNQRPTYRLRVSNVKLQSNGNVPKDADTLTFGIVFWDKDFNRVGEDIMPVAYTNGLHRYKDDDNLLLFLERGSGTYYADFATFDTYDNAIQLKEIAEKARYYTIY